MTTSDASESERARGIECEREREFGLVHSSVAHLEASETESNQISDVVGILASFCFTLGPEFHTLTHGLG